ncbi:MAG: exodeoxyribonuclease VII large subunit [Rhodospirillales bacterium CG15_BIG_FIL_POST_REV_8_21_14_020_66_15]|nr:MAG: exodeoxyribonuclease VII large subunit [Rhodospirillales bacterium CG15_BIG_FIL_POST_REV_8_21_14_020_66_15]
MKDNPSGTAQSQPGETGFSHNLPVFTVSEISQAVKHAVEENFQWVRIRGELSGFKRAASGHLYFSLKDAEAVIDGVCWRGTAGRLGLKPEDGMEVIATGRLTTYPGRSKYQVIVDHMELAGEGALLKLLEDRRRKLEAEGLFAPERKRELPYLPEVIGVVTSPTGAVIRDILHRLADRFPVHVLLWPVLVQGDGAAAQVAAALRGFDGIKAGGPVPRPDVVIVARGGGSLEDLWAFNEEEVVRAIAECGVPVISAVGHETDTTLADFAADRRAPTPTAAAEMAVPVRLDLLAQVMEDGQRIAAAVSRRLTDHRRHLDATARALPNPARMLQERAQRLDDWTGRLGHSLGAGLERRRARLNSAAAGLIRPDKVIQMEARRLAAETRALRAAGRAAVDRARNRLGQAAALLDSYSYERVLERGFALVTDRDGAPVTSVKGLKPGDRLDVRLRDGARPVTVAGDDAPPKERTKRSTTPKTDKPGDDRQGRLL